MPAEPLAAWHDFVIMAGTAAATLIGLLFVAASVGAGVFTQQRQAGMRVFLSPSVVHFCCVLAAALIVVAPIRAWTVAGVLIVANGVFGAVYAGFVCRTMIRHGLGGAIDWSDRVWYAAVPAVGYAVMLAAGAALARGDDAGGALLAAAIGLLLAAGIRNAWDMTTWIVLRPRE